MAIYDEAKDNINRRKYNLGMCWFMLYTRELDAQQGFLLGIDLWGRHFGKNGQKLHENYKINVFEVGYGGHGDKLIFQVVEGSLSNRRNPAQKLHYFANKTQVANH